MGVPGVVLKPFPPQADAGGKVVQFFQAIRHQMYRIRVNHGLIFASPSGLMQEVPPFEFHFIFEV
jgi:hypothetical protein